jgi:hypothetical protein
MKKPLFLCIAVLLSLALAAQKVDLDKFYFNATYRQLPHRPLDTSYRTYSVVVETGRLNRVAMREDNLSDQVYIDGWRKLVRNGHLIVNLRLEDVMIEGSETKERVEILKDKDGKQTGTRSHYSVQLKYSYAARALINDYKGSTVLNLTLATRANKQTWSTAEFDSKAEAEANFRFGIISMTGDIMRQVASNTTSEISTTLTDYYGFTTRSYTDFMWILDSKKHPEYEAHRQAWLTVKQAFFQMTADDPLDKTREMLQPAIDYFQSIKKKYPGTSKWDKKLRYASYYALSKIFYYLDDADAAMHEASGLVMNDFDSRDGKMLENWAIDLKWALTQSKLRSRHFPIIIDQLYGPDVNATSSK